MKTIARWWRRRQAARLPSSVFVICEKGVPVAACLNRGSVSDDVETRDHAKTRIFTVPLKGHHGE